MRWCQLWIYTIIFSLMGLTVATAADIVIQGNRYASEKMILRKLQAPEVKRYSLAQINQMTQNLLQTGIFAEVSLTQEQNILIVKVQENPFIQEIVFAQNGRQKELNLSDYLVTKAHSFLDKAKIYEDVRLLGEYYTQSGYLNAKITVKTESLADNNVRLVFEINRGKKVKIKAIKFTGNTVFNAATLIKEIDSTVSHFFTFTGGRNLYNRERLENDKKKLITFYANQGYADANIEVSTVEIDKEQNQLTLLFLITEGKRYQFGQSTISNRITYLDEGLLTNVIKEYPNQHFSQTIVNDNVEAIRVALENAGFLFSNVSSKLHRNDLHNVVDVEYIISEAPRVYINKINIFGNDRTRDYVILRELSFLEGDAFDTVKYHMSRQNLGRLGYFSNVELTLSPTAVADRADLDVKVVEQKTGQLNFGFGYSSIDGFNLNAALQEMNLFGSGNAGSLSIMYAGDSVSGGLNYSRPYFMGTPITLNSGFYYNTLVDYENLSYDSKSYGFNVGMNYKLTKNFSHSISYELNYQEISNVDEWASTSIRESEGKQLKSSINNSLTYERRDNRRNPTSGYYVTVKNNAYGLGGDRKYMVYKGEAAKYWQVFPGKEFIFKFMLEGGYMHAMGGDYLKSSDNFRLGGSNFRGFEYNGIGPYDRRSGDHLGGRNYYKGTVELKIPNGIPKDANVVTSLFLEAGTVTGLDKKNTYYERQNIVDDGNLRVSTGLSVMWGSPVGPIRLDFSKALRHEDYDRVESFRFSFGTSF